MRRLFTPSLIIILCLPHATFSQERYLLEGNQVLLYKMINWWYFAPSEDSATLCGEFLEYRNIGNAKIRILENDSVAEISFADGFAPLLSVIGECETCSTPASTQARWINTKYFEGSKATLHIEESPHTNIFSIYIENIEKSASKVLKENQNQLAFILTGTVQGLQNGKIGLHPAGDILGKCTYSKKKTMGPSAVHLVVSLSEGGPPLIKFDVSAIDSNYSNQ